MESQPQNPEFRIDPENFHPWVQSIQCHLIFFSVCLDISEEQCKIVLCFILKCLVNVNL